MSLANEIKHLHQPDPSHVQVPGIIQYGQACHECWRSWPCESYKLADKQDKQ